MLQIDLADVQKLAPFNDNVRFLFCGIDVFSRFAFVIPLATKSADDTLEAWQKVLNQAKHWPQSVVSDRGSEIKNKKFIEFCHKHGIHTSYSDTSVHSPYIERFIGTLKVLMTKYRTEKQTNRFIDQLHKLVDTYNSRRHSTIKLTPKQGELEKYHGQMRRENQKRWDKVKKKKPRYRVGQLVLVSKQKETFFRKFHQHMQEEVFRIKKIKTNLPKPLYGLESYDDREEIEGLFYEFELTPIKITDKTFKIEKILENKQIQGENWVLVKFRGYREPSWTKESDIIEL